MTSKRGDWNKIVIDELNKRITGEIKAREIIFLCAVGRLVSNAEYSSFNLLIHSESSAGKDYIAKQILKLFPELDVYARTRISPVVLNYWKPYSESNEKSWNQKVLYLPDISDAIINCEALKLMCSEGSHITITEKGHAKDIEIKGKPVIITTTASATPTEEILNRFSVVKLDESEEQTRAIMKMQSQIAREGSYEEYSSKVKKFLAELKSYDVEVPFANKIEKHFPSKLVRERRNFNRFIDFIKAVAVFHQEDRTHHHDGTLKAELEDYDIAKDIFMNLYSGVAEIPLNRNQKEIVKVMEKEKEPLSAQEILSKLGSYITIQGFRPHLDSLVNIRVLDKFMLRDTFNCPITKYQISQEFTTKQPIKLPNSDEL